MVSSSSAPPAIFSAKSMTICVKLTGPGASESMPDASPSEIDFPTPAKADDKVRARQETVLVSIHDTKGLFEFLDLSLGEESKHIGATLLGFFDPEPFAIVYYVFG